MFGEPVLIVLQISRRSSCNFFHHFSELPQEAPEKSPRSLTYFSAEICRTFPRISNSPLPEIRRILISEHHPHIWATSPIHKFKNFFWTFCHLPSGIRKHPSGVRRASRRSLQNLREKFGKLSPEARWTFSRTSRNFVSRYLGKYTRNSVNFSQKFEEHCSQTHKSFPKSSGTTSLRSSIELFKGF